MSLRPILLHPHPRLKGMAKPIAQIDEGIRRLADAYESLKPVTA